MRLWGALFVVVALVFAALVSADTAGPEYGPAEVVRGGGVEGGDALYLPGGDILNVRNVQGGMVGDPNLDLGAGSTTHPGTLSLNYDVGRCTIIFDGRKRKLARFCPNGIVFYRRPKIVERGR